MAEPTYPLDLPNNVGFTTSEWRIIRSVSVTESPFTFGQTAHKFTGSRWQTTVKLPAMKRADAVQFQAFFMQLNGRFGTFLLGDPDAKTIRGSETSATVKINGSHSVGAYSISVKNCTASTANIFRQGDYVQFGSGATSKLHMIISDVTSNSSGVASLEIEPSLKTALSDNDDVVYSNTKGVFRMDSDDLSWNADISSNYTFAFSCTEVL